MEYYVFITNDCNLNCKYCSVLLKNKMHNIPSDPIYSLSELNQFIHTTQLKYNDQCADIVFFGGEPTLNYKYIREIIQSHKNNINVPYKYTYMLHTNGILLGSIPDDILLNIDAIMLSINYDICLLLNPLKIFHPKALLLIGMICLIFANFQNLMNSIKTLS